MTLIDDRGRLLGKANLIDVVVGLVVLLLIPLSYGAYRLFRTPLPEILAIVPTTIQQAPHQRVRVEGRNLRPYLMVLLGSTRTESFMVETPWAGEVVLPEVAPGVYDLVFYDAAKEVARQPRAVTVVPRNPDVGSSVEDVTIRFFVWPEALSLLKVGDREIPAGLRGALGSQSATPAELISFRPSGKLTATALVDGGHLDVKSSQEPDVSAVHYDVPLRVREVEAVVRIAVVERLDGRSHNTQFVKLGAQFSFETTSYVMHGVITGVRPAPPVPAVSR